MRRIIIRCYIKDQINSELIICRQLTYFFRKFEEQLICDNSFFYKNGHRIEIIINYLMSSHFLENNYQVFHIILASYGDVFNMRIFLYVVYKYSSHRSKNKIIT